MAENMHAQETEINPADYMTRLGSRLRVNKNREAGRYVASFAGVYEKLDQRSKKLVLGMGRTEIDACRALAMKMRDLHAINRLQVLADPSNDDDKATVVAPTVSCNTWFKRV